MNTIIKKSLQSLLLVPALALGVSAVAPVLQPTVAYAQENGECSDITGGLANGAACAKGKDQSANIFGDGGVFTTVVNTLLFIVGAIAVIMLVYGGFKYIISGGDASAVTAAKNTILYAVIGIIVALIGYAIINFVITQITAAGQ